MVFVNSMSDMFHENVPLDYIRRVFDVMAEADRHTYQILTKRHERMAELAPLLDWPPNVWMGVSIENRRWIERTDYLRQVPAAVRFVSAEPLLGPLDGLDLTGVHWLIVGGESGPHHRLMRPEWARELRDKCRREGVAFFFKQWGGIRPQSNGRLLDGREWNQMPTTAYETNGKSNGAGKARRQRDIPDSHPDKWIYSEHARAKHGILRGYLGAWFSILGQGRGIDRLIILDGFAGKGQYRDGEPGSPKIIFDRAVEVVEAGHAKKVVIGCVEKDRQNFEELSALCETLKHPQVTIAARHKTFAEAASDLAKWAEKRRKPTPIFVTADPYGFRGVPLKVIKKLLALKRTEVLVTFMARDMSRFLNEPNVESPLRDFFGGDAWRECAELGLNKRPPCLLLQYQKVVRPDIATWATPFRVYEDERKTVLYYLVHLTNNDLGMRKMKRAMIKQSGDMTFWPVTVRPPNQLAIELAEPSPLPTLQKHLMKKYAGRTMTFLEVMNDDYPDGLWLEPDYRTAIKAMAQAKEPSVTITRDRTTQKGKPATSGLKEEDKVTFS
jgi:three-Cys-motif partner protein